MRVARLAWLFFRLGSLNELQYRANFFIQLLQTAVAVGTAIVVLALIYSQTEELNGWSEAELLVVMGIQILLGGVIPLLPPWGGKTPLTLTHLHRYPSGIVSLHYAPR